MTIWNDPPRPVLPAPAAKQPPPKQPPPKQPPAKNLGIYDLIVIGSSFGGVMAAWPSVMAGKNVLMIERGDWVPRGPQNRGADGFFALTSVQFRRAYRVLAGGEGDTLGTIACVGGASVFFGGVSLRLRERDFEVDPEIVGGRGRMAASTGSRAVLFEGRSAAWRGWFGRAGSDGTVAVGLPSGGAAACADG